MSLYCYILHQDLGSFFFTGYLPSLQHIPDLLLLPSSGSPWTRMNYDSFRFLIKFFLSLVHDLQFYSPFTWIITVQDKIIQHFRNINSTGLLLILISYKHVLHDTHSLQSTYILALRTIFVLLSCFISRSNSITIILIIIFSLVLSHSNNS